MVSYIISISAALSLLALVIKGILFIAARDVLFQRNTILAVFPVALFMLNLAEFTLLISNISSIISLWAMKRYYVAAVFTAAAFLSLTMSLPKPRKLAFWELLATAGLIPTHNNR